MFIDISDHSDRFTQPLLERVINGIDKLHFKYNHFDYQVYRIWYTQFLQEAICIVSDTQAKVE